MIKKISLLLLMVVVTAPLHAQSQSKGNANQPPTTDELLKWHEVLTYKVRYSFFNLGKVTIEIVSDTTFNGKEAYYLKTVINSSGIPLIGDERNRYSSIFTAEGNAFKALTFWTDNLDEEKYNTARYTFDYEKDKVYGYVKEKNKRDTLNLKKHASAGLLMFYMSRLQAGTDTTVTRPIYINLKQKKLSITHTTKKIKRKYEAFDHPVTVYFSHGHAGFDGPFGFSGSFEGWYTTGNLRIPVEAHVDVFLGSVKLKLIDYKKELR